VNLGHETLEVELVRAMADVAIRLSAHFFASERWDDALQWARLANRLTTQVRAN
jgi:hypothetical protein